MSGHNQFGAEEEGELISYGGYSLRDLVLMRPIPEEADEPCEKLEVIGFDRMPWGVSVTGIIPERWRAPDDRDGLREFTVDQIDRHLTEAEKKS